MSESPVVAKFKFDRDVWVYNMRVFLGEAGYSPEQIEEQLLERKHMAFGQQEKSYPASIVQKAIQYSNDIRSHTELERIMDLLMGLQSWQILVHASEISNVHVGKEIKIIGGQSGVLSDWRDAGERHDASIWLVVNGKLVPVKRWDDIIIYMSEE